MCMMCRRRLFCKTWTKTKMDIRQEAATVDRTTVMTITISRIRQPSGKHRILIERRDGRLLAILVSLVMFTGTKTRTETDSAIQSSSCSSVNRRHIHRCCRPIATTLRDKRVPLKWRSASTILTTTAMERLDHVVVRVTRPE